jgi:hypothetical protein
MNTLVWLLALVFFCIVLGFLIKYYNNYMAAFMWTTSFLALAAYLTYRAVNKK